jgi:hypothetical protein
MENALSLLETERKCNPHRDCLVSCLIEEAAGSPGHSCGTAGIRSEILGITARGFLGNNCILERSFF